MSTSRLIYGFHAITAKLRHDPDSLKEIMVDATRQDARARDLLAHAELQGVKIIITDGKRLDGMAPGAKHQGVIARVEGGRKAAHLDDVLEFVRVVDRLGVVVRDRDQRRVHLFQRPSRGRPEESEPDDQDGVFARGDAFRFTQQ